MAIVIFHKEGDYEAFEEYSFAEGLVRYPCPHSFRLS